MQIISLERLGGKSKGGENEKMSKRGNLVKRRSPTHHTVRAHTREGRSVQKYVRGKGQPKVKRRPSKVVTRREPAPMFGPPLTGVDPSKEIPDYVKPPTHKKSLEDLLREAEIIEGTPKKEIKIIKERIQHLTKVGVPAGHKIIHRNKEYVTKTGKVITSRRKAEREVNRIRRMGGMVRMEPVKDEDKKTAWIIYARFKPRWRPPRKPPESKKRR